MPKSSPAKPVELPKALMDEIFAPPELTDIWCPDEESQREAEAEAKALRSK